MMQKISWKSVKTVVSSPSFFRWVVVIFIVQALLSVFFISASTPMDGVGAKYVQRNENGVVPDGHRHLGAIYYYAERPLLSGPVISEMSESDLWMGDLVRFPSYFYYYLLSFPARLAVQFGASDLAIIYLVRLIGVGFGVATLFLFRSIVRLVTKSRAIQHISTLAFALTGSFVWLAAAENYDVMALMLWFAFIYASMNLFIKKDAKYLYWMALTFLIAAITKYTYIPFAAVFGAVAIGLYLKNKNALTVAKAWRVITKDIVLWVGTLRKVTIAGAIALLIVSAGLFTERIVGNLVTYQSFNPSCPKIHSQEGCMKFGVYARNYNQKKNLESGKVQPIEYVPVISYPAYWVKRYFDSMYVYMGHVYIPVYSLFLEVAGVVAVIIGIILLVLARRGRIPLFKSQSEYYLLGTVVLLTVVQFIFNLRTILNYGGQTYAHQGRYLLSVVGFAYILYLIVLQRVLMKQSAKTKKRLLLAGGIVAIYSILVVSAVPSFIIHAEHGAWYSEFAKDTLPEWVINRN